MTGGSSFRPEHRLRRPAEFALVMASPLRVRGERFEVRYRRNDGPAPRLGLIIPKRLAKRAVLRNILKRLIRESFRQRRMELPANDLVFRLARPPMQDGIMDRRQRAIWRAEIDGLLEKIRA